MPFAVPSMNQAKFLHASHIGRGKTKTEEREELTLLVLVNWPEAGTISSKDDIKLGIPKINIMQIRASLMFSCVR